MFTKTNASSSTTPEVPKKNNTVTSKASSSASAPSILGRDLIITGDIKTDGDIQIDGRLDGNIKAGNVTVGEQGAVNGKILSKTCHIRGKVTGKIDSGIIDIAETGNVQADLLQDQLTIANGAFFDGKCSRKSAAPTPIKSASSATKKSA